MTVALEFIHLAPSAFHLSQLYPYWLPLANGRFDQQVGEASVLADRAVYLNI